MSGATEVIEVPCPVFGSNSLRTLFDAYDYVNPDFKERFGVCRCIACEASFVSPRPREEDMGRYYPAAFYWQFEGGKSLGADELLDARRQQLEEKRCRLTTFLPEGCWISAQ